VTARGWNKTKETAVEAKDAVKEKIHKATE
jgi:hypothetical protein